MKISLAVTGALCAAAVSTATFAAKPTTRNRAEIPAEYRWDFSAIYPSWAAWEEGMKEMDSRIDAFASLKGTLGQGAGQLLKAYQALDEIYKLMYRLDAYAQLQRDVDTRDQAVGGRYQRITCDRSPARDRVGMVHAGAARDRAGDGGRLDRRDPRPRAVSVPDPRGLPPEGARPRRARRAAAFAGQPVQRHAADDLLGAEHLRHEVPTLRLQDGRDVVLSPGNYSALLQQNRDQAERGRAAASHLGAYAATANTYASIYNGTLQRDWFVARARNFDTTLDAALDANAIPRAVVENLIDATRAGSAPFQRYARLRQKLLGLPTYHLYDATVPIYRSDKVYAYEEARELATASVAPLGEDYVSKFKRFVFGSRVDVYENEGKRGGAYSAGVYGVGPYMLMNYNDTINAAFTLAHEAGHSMHTVLAFETQPFATADYTIFVAEVASTTNERFLLDQMLRQTSDPKERFLLLQHAVDSIVGTFYTQVLFADFELRAHRLVEKGEPADDGGAQQPLRRPAQGVLGRRRGHGRLLQVHLGADPALLQFAVLRLSVRDVLRLVGAALWGDDERLRSGAQGGDGALPDAAQERRQRQSDGAAREGGCRPDPARDDPGGHRSDGPARVAVGGRGGQDPLVASSRRAARIERFRPADSRPASRGSTWPVMIR
jgi:oligoendopeptidase F